MDTYKVTITTTNEAVEAVSNLLMEANAQGVQIDNAADYQNLHLKPDEIIDLANIKQPEKVALVSGYFEKTPTLVIDNLVAELTKSVLDLQKFDLDPGLATIATALIQEEDWANNWKQYYEPIRITRYLTIVPSWSDYQAVDERESLIYLDPGMAFGTGDHPTTRLSLQMLEIMLKGQEVVMDVGTGSGVLSIAAAHLGAKKIFAYDVDQVAVNVAQENFDLNPTAKGIIAQPNDLLENVSAKADVIIANILAEILVPLIPQTKARLNPNGHLLLTGIIEDKADLIQKTLQDNQYAIEQTLKMGEWVAFVAKRKIDED